MEKKALVHGNREPVFVFKECVGRIRCNRALNPPRAQKISIYFSSELLAQDRKKATASARGKKRYILMNKK